MVCYCDAMVQCEQLLLALGSQQHHMAQHCHTVGRRIRAVHRELPDVAVLGVLGQRQRALLLRQPAAVRLVQLRRPCPALLTYYLPSLTY